MKQVKEISESPWWWGVSAVSWKSVEKTQTLSNLNYEIILKKKAGESQVDSANLGKKKETQKITF